jgi:cytochrome c biogenesis protein CcdA
MLRLLGVVVSVGLADSLNPATVGPALYLASGAQRIRRVLEFTAGVFAVNLVAGIVLTFGPGRLLLGLVPHPRGTVRHIIELVAGVVLLAAAIGVWKGRHRLARQKLPMQDGGGSPLLAGATISAVDLPTAAPYFAVVAGIVASTATVPEEIALLLIYNLAFVAPLLAIAVVLAVAGTDAEPLLERAAEWLQRRWPVVLAALLLFVGAALTVLGGTGLVKE